MKTIVQAKYLGGHPSHPKGQPVSLQLDDDGVRAKVVRTVLVFPWDEVTSIEVEGPEGVEKRVTATRLLTLGVFAFAAKKKSKLSYVVVGTAEGEAIFEVAKHTPMEMRAKLSWTAAKVG